MASILPTVSVADPVYHHEQRATSMKKLEAIKKRLPLQDAKDTIDFSLMSFASIMSMEALV